MNMENIIFVGIVLAIGIILYSVMQLAGTRRAVNHPHRAHGRSGLIARRRMVGGITETEWTPSDMRRRVDKWQKAQMVRWAGVHQSAEALSGQKYEFDAAKFRRERREKARRRRQKTSAAVRQQFMLID